MPAHTGSEALWMLRFAVDSLRGGVIVAGGVEASSTGGDNPTLAWVREVSGSLWPAFLL